jgi:hypothetical protein
MKERHSTANQLRKYYLECLKQILDEDKEDYKNNQPTKSNEEKLKIMEERLRLPGEKNGRVFSSFCMGRLVSKSFSGVLLKILYLIYWFFRNYEIQRFNVDKCNHTA